MSKTPTQKVRIELPEDQVNQIIQEVRKALTEFMHEEIEVRVKNEVRKEVQRIFREMGRL